MTPEELQEIRARCEKVTPGPWMVCCSCTEGYTQFSILQHIQTQVTLGEEYWADSVDPTEGDYGYFTLDDQADIPDRKYNDAVFIAHARSDIPRLLDEIVRLQTALAAYESTTLTESP